MVFFREKKARGNFQMAKMRVFMSFQNPTLATMLVPAALFHKLDMCSAADVIKQQPNVDSIVVGWDMQLTALKVVPWMNSKKTHTTLTWWCLGVCQLEVDTFVI